MEPAAAELVRNAEAAEFNAGKPVESVEAYQSALSLISNPIRQHIIRYALARVLRKAGRNMEATVIFREIAYLPPNVKDEDGMPLCLDGCETLID